jgi:hypothetical protein
MHPSSLKTLSRRPFPKSPRTQSEASQFSGSHNYKTKTNYHRSYIDCQSPIQILNPICCHIAGKLLNDNFFATWNLGILLWGKMPEKWSIFEIWAHPWPFPLAMDLNFKKDDELLETYLS